MKKIVWAGLIIVVTCLIAVGVFWLSRRQTVTFDDGSKFTLLAVQYGKNHVAPTLSDVKHAHSITTANDTLVVWLHEQYDADQEWRNFQFYAYDKALTACVSAFMQGGGAYNNRKVNQVIGLSFPAFPRRQSEFILRIQEQSNGGSEMGNTDFHIHHSVGEFTSWGADPLPSTDSDNDLSVTLTKLVAGLKAPYNSDNDDPDDAVNKGVQAIFQVQRNGHSVTNWQPVAVETTDATGNQVTGQIENNQWQDASDTVQYQFGLWNDEPAWKMQFEFSQQSDFTPEESWFVPNIPVEPGTMQDFYNGLNNRRGSPNNPPFAESDLNGYHLKIFPAKAFTNMSPNSQPQGGLIIQISPVLSKGMRLTIVRLTDDQTNDINFWENTWSPARGMLVDQCQLRDLGGATNLNLSIALHKSRFVEFTTKPDAAPPSPPDNSQ